MAKKETTKAPAAAQAAANATPPAANAEGTKPAVPAKPKTIDTFKHLKGVSEGEKLAPQARVMVNVLADHPKGLTREDFCKALEGKLVTRQPIGRIVTYYQKSLVERGYISIESVEVAS